MALWFSASAVAPELTDLWGLAAGEAARLASAVQVGFVVGAVISAVSTLSDTVPPNYLFAVESMLGAAATTALALCVESATPAIALRFLTGVALAGVSSTGMKLVSGWFREGRGLAIGALVGCELLAQSRGCLTPPVGGSGFQSWTEPGNERDP